MVNKMSDNKINFETVEIFEKEIAKFFGSPYAIAVDSCTHGIELCLRYTEAKKIIVPKRTYLSIPFLAHKLNIDLEWKDENWIDYYYLTNNIIDAAVLWKSNSYIPNTFMCISFQYQKHLKIGRGGIILIDNKEAAIELKKMSYDGRLPIIPWREQNIDTIGYHYYLLPELAKIGLDLLENAINTPPRQWLITDWPDLTEMDVFKNNLKRK
jgi:dTDP-4-amino-4,6-dideoxygalactose transaminase